MDPSDLLADLPDPRDDEPSSLRSDIAEELTDHLVCSVRREMVKGADESTAWERALKRFGDPRQIARKLWWLAMRRRIMNQRLMLGLQGAMFVAMIAIVFVVLQSSGAQQKQMARQQELLLAALDRLGERREAPVAPTSPATLEVEMQPAAPDRENATVGIQGLHLNNVQIATYQSVDPKTGVADFGQIPTGAYRLQIQAGEMATTRRIRIDAGQQVHEVFELPHVPTGKVSVPFEVVIPADFQPLIQEHNLVIACEFTSQPVESAGESWAVDQDCAVAWTPEGLRFPSGSDFSFFDGYDGGPYGERAMMELKPQRESNGGRMSLRKQARFRLTCVRLLSGTVENQDYSGERKKFMVHNTPLSAALKSDNPDWPAEFNAVFVAEADKPWRVTLPPALIAAARAQLAELAAHPPQPGQIVAGSPAPATPDPKHNRVQVRVVEGTADGAVIKSAKVTLKQPAWEQPLEPAVDDDGVLDFGYLDAGVYTLTTRLTWWGLEESRRFVVHPGKDHTETVVAPPPPQRGFDVKVVIPLNARLREAKSTANFLPQLERCAKPFEKWVPHGVTLDVDNGIPPDVNWFGGTVSEWEGDSLTMTLKLCPGTYSPAIHSFRLFEPLPEPNRVRLLAPRPEPGSPVARFEEAPPPFTVKGPNQEWRIDLPTNLVGGALDSLTTAQPAGK